MPSFRTLLVLGRVSNLPTVWSNCLAGWWLGGGSNLGKLPLLFVGTSLLYIAGMYLNDAFDAEFDGQRRSERPIPSGAVSAGFVWRAGFGMLLLGNALLFAASLTAGILGCCLALSILLYDAVHKAITISPIIMGTCRVFVYLVAAAIGADGITGEATWSGLALGIYVVGLSFVARRESFSQRPPLWPIVLVTVPILLALVMNVGEFREGAVIVALILALWILRALRTTYLAEVPNIGRTISSLLAGIVFVDWLAVAHAPYALVVTFIGLFIASLLGQRYIPAT